MGHNTILKAKKIVPQAECFYWHQIEHICESSCKTQITFSETSWIMGIKKKNQKKIVYKIGFFLFFFYNVKKKNRVDDEVSSSWCLQTVTELRSIIRN